MIKISQISEQLTKLFEEIDFVAAYARDKAITIYENKIEEEINTNALQFYCINSLGDESTDKDEIIVDYGESGFLSFYQLNPGSWLIVATNKRQFPLVNLEVKKIKRGVIIFDLENSDEQALPQIEETIIVEKSVEQVDQKLQAAKRLQQRILPDLSVLGTYFNKHFSYYSPEDVLSGDFYWLKETEDSLYIVVADCTGHSIEGALAAMTVNAVLNQNIVDNPVDSLKSVYADLRKSDNSNSEGYAIGVELAICKYDKKSGSVDVATSGVPVLYIEGEENYNLLKIKGTQDPNASEPKIESIKLYTNKGDKLILYSDGLADQFDKDDKKKLGNAGVRKMFMSMNGSFSGPLFEKNFSAWKGSTRQLDDITVLALEI